MMLSSAVLSSVLIATLGLASGGHVEGVDDSILFKLRWNDPLGSVDLPPAKFQDHEVVRIMSADQEPYVCFVPRKLEVKPSETASYSYDGPTPLDLLKPLFVKRICRYKLDHYWTYQLCHGRTLRQYHEDTTTTKVLIVEFYLGKYDLDMMKRDNERYKADLTERRKALARSSLPTIKLDGVDHPYFAVNMSYGTLCDINQRPRTAQIWYVCDPLGDHDMHSFEEPASCTYRVVVRTPLLCEHPDYKIEKAPENEISCHPEKKAEAKASRQSCPVDEKDGHQSDAASKYQDPLLEKEAAPPSCNVDHINKGVTDTVDEKATDNADGNEPAKLVEMVRENINFRQEAMQDWESSSEGISFEDHLKRTLKVFYLNEGEEPPIEAAVLQQDSKHVDKFLSGDLCLQGGTGWWKYEFCYGKNVKQFHVEKGKRTQEILLGRWKPLAHLEWVKALSSRKFQSTSNFVRHLFTDGDVCEVTGKPRTVEVRLTCQKSERHPDATALSLQEPKPCEYRLTVESGNVCPILRTLNEFGLPADETPVETHQRTLPLSSPSITISVQRQEFVPTAVSTLSHDDVTPSTTHEDHTTPAPAHHDAASDNHNRNPFKPIVKKRLTNDDEADVVVRDADDDVTTENKHLNTDADNNEPLLHAEGPEGVRQLPRRHQQANQKPQLGNQKRHRK